jgi:hypothetical protein
MAEPRPPDEAASADDHDATAGDLGAPRFCWFDGILEGRSADPILVRAQVEHCNASGYGRMDLDLSGNRFSILMDDRVIPAERMTEVQRQRFVAGLMEIVASVESPAHIESTLRCTEVYEAVVRETLFSMLAGQFEGVVRVRPVHSEDLRRAPRSAVAAYAGFGGRRLALVGILALVAFGLVGWQGGYIDRLLATGASELRLEHGPLAGALRVTITDSWGQYLIKIGRGERYPATNDALAERLRETSTLVERAAVNAVANGEVVFVHLESDTGQILAVARSELRALLASDTAEVEVRLPGRWSAAVVRLALDAGNR